MKKSKQIEKEEIEAIVHREVIKIVFFVLMVGVIICIIILSGNAIYDAGVFAGKMAYGMNYTCP